MLVQADTKMWVVQWLTQGCVGWSDPTDSTLMVLGPGWLDLKPGWLSLRPGWLAGPDAWLAGPEAWFAGPEA